MIKKDESVKNELAGEECNPILAVSHVLLLEDDESLNVMLTTVLQEDGFVVFSAQTCSEAFALLERKQIDCALLDNQLPDGSGLDVLTKIREAALDMPVLLMSGARNTEAVRRAASLNAVEFLEKPVSAETVKYLLHMGAKPNQEWGQN